MGELVRQTLDEIMQIAAEKIALNEDSFSFISVWQILQRIWGNLMLNMTKQVNKLLIY